MAPPTTSAPQMSFNYEVTRLLWERLLLLVPPTPPTPKESFNCEVGRHYIKCLVYQKA